MTTAQTAQVARFRLGIGRPTEIARRAVPCSVADVNNARREAEYVARRNGVKPALIQLWRCP